VHKASPGQPKAGQVLFAECFMALREAEAPWLQLRGLSEDSTLYKTAYHAGMWRIDPLKLSRVVDRFGKKVASAELGRDASMIGAAPDLYDVRKRLEATKGNLGGDA